mgnify:CR=1 FL=1
MKEYGFEKLEVWKISRELAGKIYQITKKFPEDEKFGLINQMRRSSVSISSNLAEGSTRTTNKDRVYFITISYGSLMELLNQLILSYDFEFINENEYIDLRNMIADLSKKLSAYRNFFMNSKFFNTKL